VFGDDAPDNRQAESAAATLGGVVRQEQLLALAGRDAGPVVGDDDSDGRCSPASSCASTTIWPRRSIASMALSTR
jgi:hypothetical protein